MKHWVAHLDSVWYWTGSRQQCETSVRDGARGNKQRRRRSILWGGRRCNPRQMRSSSLTFEVESCCVPGKKGWVNDKRINNVQKKVFVYVSLQDYYLSHTFSTLHKHQNEKKLEFFFLSICFLYNYLLLPNFLFRSKTAKQRYEVKFIYCKATFLY